MAAGRLVTGRLVTGRVTVSRRAAGCWMCRCESSSGCWPAASPRRPRATSAWPGSQSCWPCWSPAP